MYQFLLLFGFVFLTGCTVLTPDASPPSPTPAPTFTPAVHPTEIPPNRIISLPDPASAAWKEVLTGFTRPLALTNAGDDRVFVVEQRGFIWTVDWDQDKPQVFLDIRDRVNDRERAGLARTGLPPRVQRQRALLRELQRRQR